MYLAGIVYLATEWYQHLINIKLRQKVFSLHPAFTSCFLKTVLLGVTVYIMEHDYSGYKCSPVSDIRAFHSVMQLFCVKRLSCENITKKQASIFFC